MFEVAPTTSGVHRRNVLLQLCVISTKPQSHDILAQHKMSALAWRVAITMIGHEQFTFCITTVSRGLNLPIDIFSAQSLTRHLPYPNNELSAGQERPPRQLIRKTVFPYQLSS
jgi:hypothetical protein